jgi:hypothetical protein
MERHHITPQDVRCFLTFSDVFCDDVSVQLQDHVDLCQSQ